MTEIQKPVLQFNNLVHERISLPSCKSLRVDKAARTASSLLHWAFI